MKKEYEMLIAEKEQEYRLMVQNYENRIAKLQAEHKQEIETLKEQWDKERSEMQQRIRESDEKCEELRKNINRLRSAAQDGARLYQRNRRLVQPVTLSEMQEAYKPNTVTASVSAFCIHDNHDLTWIVPKYERLRRYNGFVAQFLDSCPEYPVLAQDDTFLRSLPWAVQSSPSKGDKICIHFVHRRNEREFILCMPHAASAMVVKCWILEFPELQAWRDAHASDIIVDESLADNPNVHEIYFVLPFPTKLADTQFVPEIDTDLSVESLQLLQQRHETDLRNDCQIRYQKYYFGDSYSATDAEDDSSEN